MGVRHRGYVMDSLRGEFYDADLDPQGIDSDDDHATFGDAPPSPVGQDERRMQVRAYNFWASLLENRNYPSIEDLDPTSLPDFGPHSVLLDFSTGVDNPAIPYLGELLVDECGGDGSAIEHLADVPSRSLLSRITDHYMQIIANQAPVGFEAEFVNQAGNTVLYRGILLPFSSDDETIDFIYGVINWKELADQDTTDALMLEVDQSLELSLAEAIEEEDDEVEIDRFPPAPDFDDAQVDGWADGPAADGSSESEDSGEVRSDTIADLPDDGAPLPGTVGDSYELPEPSFGLKRTVDMIVPPAVDASDEPFDLGGYAEDDGDSIDPASYAPDYGDTEENETGNDSVYASLAGAHVEALPDERAEEEWAEFGDEPALPVEYEAPAETSPKAPALLAVAAPETDRELAELAPEDMDLADWLASARELAQAAKGSEERTRFALYHAIGRAYDFSIAAQNAPEDFERIVTDAGLTVQDRAPMTPIVKLVFGANYDKTRVTEYAAALSHAHRLGVDRGELAQFLSNAEGGLKGVVREERRLRREDQGKPVGDSDGVRGEIADKLRALAPQRLEHIGSDGAEFALLMVRRDEDGTIALLGEVPEDIALVEKAARKLLD
jgi:hypothetical protein